jgi:LysR family transcriptional activator of nhaA
VFNYNHLYYFYVTAKLGGVSNAAKYLNISQPSLSSQLKVLESSLDKKFFEKHGRRMQLTDEGESAFTYCKRLFEVAEEFAASLKAPQDLQNQKVHIGISEQVERTFIADLISPLLQDRKKNIQKVIHVTSDPDDELLRRLRTREIDLFLTNKPVYSDDVKELAAISMPVNLMISTRVLKASKIRVSRTMNPAEFIQSSPWGLVLPSNKLKLRHETDLFFQEIKARKRIVFESDILSVVGRALMDGAGIGFLPMPYALEEIKMGLLTVLGPKTGYWKHMLYLIARNETRYDGLIEEVRNSVKQIEKII